VFQVDESVFATLAGLTISGGGSFGSNIESGGGIDNAGYLTVASSAISDNAALDGGGIWNTGDLTLTDSSVTHDSGGYGGGIDNSGTVTAVNTTFALNSGVGAIYSYSLSYNPYDGLRLTLTNCTIASNQGTGLLVDGGTVTLNNTIVALNTEYAVGGTRASNIFVDAASATMSSSSAHNLIGTGGAGGLQIGFNGNLVGIADSGLASLANNGGPTLTIALEPGSPALGAGSVALAVDPATGLPLTTDQRGAGYARVVAGTIDIGAVESQAGSGATAAPVITGEQIRLAGKSSHHRVVGFELSFSEPLNAARAKNAANYIVTQTVKHRRKTVTQRVKLRVEFKPGADTVSLVLSSRASFALGGQLVVNASSPSGISNTSGVYLDGAGDGAPGSNAIFVIASNGQDVSR
jgi:hypothetical protein